MSNIIIKYLTRTPHNKELPDHACTLVTCCKAFKQPSGWASRTQVAKGKTFGAVMAVVSLEEPRWHHGLSWHLTACYSRVGWHFTFAFSRHRHDRTTRAAFTNICSPMTFTHPSHSKWNKNEKQSVSHRIHSNSNSFAIHAPTLCLVSSNGT